MNLSKLAGLLAVPLLLVGCAASSEEIDVDIDQAVQTALFRYTVSDVTTVDSYNSQSARDGYKLVQANLSVTNTEDDAVTMYAGVFRASWGDSESESTTCLTAISDEMVPDSYILYPEATYHGIMIFEVPEDVSQLTIQYQESLPDQDIDNVYLMTVDL